MWLCEVFARGWVALSRDARIRYKPNELEAIVQHKATLLIIVGHAPYADLARHFVLHAALIEMETFFGDGSAQQSGFLGAPRGLENG